MFLTFPVEHRGTLAAFLPQLHVFSTCSAVFINKDKNSVYTGIYIVHRHFWRDAKNAYWCFRPFLARGTGREISSMSIGKQH